MRVVLIDSATLNSSARRSKNGKYTNAMPDYCVTYNIVIGKRTDGVRETLKVDNLCNNLLTDIMEICQSVRYACDIVEFR